MPADTRPSLLSRMRDPANTRAWDEFDAQYHELILRYCTRRGLQLPDAEDIRQAVMMNLHRGLPRFQYSRDHGRFRDYLGCTVRHAIAEFFRRQKPGAVGVGGVQEPPPPTADDGLERVWEREWVLHHYRLALETVRKTSDPRSVEVFGHLLEGKSVDEITTTMNLARNAVYKTKQRMRERLRTQIALQLEEEQLPRSRGPSAVTP